jgi:hypothetical protein
MRHDFVDVVLNTIGLFDTIDLHSIIALTLNLDFFLLELLILAPATICLEILTAVIGLLASDDGTFTLCASHLSILDHGIRRSLATLFDFLFLLLSLFSSILISISCQISLGLLRWEFGWSRSLGVPVD